MTLFSIPTKIILFGVSTYVGFELAKKEFLQYRFLVHEKNDEVQSKIEKKFDPKFLELIHRLERFWKFNYNYLVPFCFGAQLMFHYMRLHQKSHYISLTRRCIMTVCWATTPTLYLSFVPFYIYFYPLVCKRSVCQEASLEYLQFLLSLKHKDFEKYVTLQSDGNIEPNPEYFTPVSHKDALDTEIQRIEAAQMKQKEKMEQRRAANLQPYGPARPPMKQ